jgi:hypothetical protein
MRSIVSSLAFFCVLNLRAGAPHDIRPRPSVETVRQFVTLLLNQSGLACTQAPLPATTKTITVDLSAGPHAGAASSINTAGLIQDVFALSSGTEFEFDHWATLAGNQLAAFRYSYQVNGQTHAGMFYADENTGAISRITFRGTNTPAHLFCSAQSR